MKALTLKQFKTALDKMVKKDPTLLRLPVVYSIDDEGNAFHRVFFTVSKGDYEVDNQPIDAVCLN